MSPKAAPAKRIAEPGDTLVNSTGVGTLGRVARWLGADPVFVDSHVTVVKPKFGVSGALLAYALLDLMPSIEALAEGSTGQTELSSTQLLSLQTPWPHDLEQKNVASILETLDETRESLGNEIEQLRRTRDELLPLLMSGKIRVREAGAL